jgi:hypothetical protein
VPVQVHQTWWAPILAALVLIALAWYEFRELEQLEAGELTSVSVSAYQALLYRLGGKWLAEAFLFVPALPLLFVGVLRFAKDRRRLS